MIRHMSLKGIKSFEEKKNVNFAPLTILTGTNSSGKSSIFQTYLLLKQGFETPASRFAGMYLNGKYVSVGYYEDWSSNNAGEPVDISIEFYRSPYEGQEIVISRRRHRAQLRSRLASYDPESLC